MQKHYFLIHGKFSNVIFEGRIWKAVGKHLENYLWSMKQTEMQINDSFKKSMITVQIQSISSTSQQKMSNKSCIWPGLISFTWYLVSWLTGC